MGREIKYFLFDVAGTLLYKPDLYRKIAETLSNNGISDVPLGEIQKIHKLVSESIKFPDSTSREFYHHFNTELLYALGIMPTKKMVEDIFTACSYLEWKRYDDTDVLKTLPVPAGIISNFNVSLRAKLEEHFPELSFRHIIVSEEKRISKPSLDFYKAAIDAIGIEPVYITYIGDSIKLDIEPALENGMNAILVDRSNQYPYYNGTRMTSLNEIKKLFN